MPGERLSMRKIREVLRLRFAQGLSQRAIGGEHRMRPDDRRACTDDAEMRRSETFERHSHGLLLPFPADPGSEAMRQTRSFQTALRTSLF